MNNEWNSEVVTEESNVDITVDQSYNASSENPQSGTAVAQAVEQAGDSVFFATYGTTTFEEIRTAHNAGKAVFLYSPAVNYNSGSLIALEHCFRSNYAEQSYATFVLPFNAYGSYQANSRIQHNTVFVVNGNNVWSTNSATAIASPAAADAGKIYMAASGGGGAMWVDKSLILPRPSSISCTVTGGAVLAELPSGQFLEPGLYQVFIKFGMDEYDSSYKHIRFGYQVDHGDNIIAGAPYDPVNIDANGPFANAANFRRTGYVEVAGADEISGFYIVFSNGTSSVINSILNNVSVTYMKVAKAS